MAGMNPQQGPNPYPSMAPPAQQPMLPGIQQYAPVQQASSQVPAQFPILQQQAVVDSNMNGGRAGSIFGNLLRRGKLGNAIYMLIRLCIAGVCWLGAAKPVRYPLDPPVLAARAGQPTPAQQPTNDLQAGQMQQAAPGASSHPGYDLEAAAPIAAPLLQQSTSPNGSRRASGVGGPGPPGPGPGGTNTPQSQSMGGTAPGAGAMGSQQSLGQVPGGIMQSGEDKEGLVEAGVVSYDNSCTVSMALLPHMRVLVATSSSAC